jgi:Domain of unknown function (DUF4760)
VTSWHRIPPLSLVLTAAAVWHGISAAGAPGNRPEGAFGSASGVRMSTADIITTTINLAALVFLGAQVMFARNALKETAKGQKEEWKRQRRKSSLDALLETTRYRESMKDVLPWNDRDRKAVEAFLEEANGDRRKLAPLREYLNHLENIAIGVRQKVFDLETISLSEGGRIIDIVTNYGTYIEGVRQELGKPLVYEEIKILAKRLEDFRSRQGAAGTVPDE